MWSSRTRRFGTSTQFTADSSNNVCIEDSYISVGDDLISIKSGWDEYGIAFGRPSSGVTIRRITGSGLFAGLRIAGDVGGHPDASYNPNVLPVVDSVTIKNVWGQNIRQAGLIRLATYFNA